MKHPIVINSRGEFVNINNWAGILAKAFMNRNGVSKLAASMIAPIRRNLDYQGIARKVLLVEPMDEKK